MNHGGVCVTLKNAATSASVVTIQHEPGTRHVCPNCGIIHYQGEFSVGVEISNGNERRRFVIGHAVTFYCCGEALPVFPLFPDEESTDQLQRDVVYHLNERGSTEGLPLIPYEIGDK